DGATMTDRADARRAGWILFRKEVQDARYRGLLVLVVGERLGSGIQPAMLDDAIKVKRALIGRGRPAFVTGSSGPADRRKIPLSLRPPAAARAPPSSRGRRPGPSTPPS